MNTLVRTLARLALGRFYVFRPMASRYRYKKVVKCPDHDQPAEILIDAFPGSPSKPKKRLFSIRNCSLWPARKGCTERCLK